MVDCPFCGYKDENGKRSGSGEVVCPRCGKNLNVPAPGVPGTVSAPRYVKPMLCWVLDIVGMLLAAGGIILMVFRLAEIGMVSSRVLLVANLMAAGTGFGFAVLGGLIYGFSMIVNHSGKSAFYLERLFLRSNER